MDLRTKGKGKDLNKGPEMWQDLGGKDLVAVTNRVCVCVCVQKIAPGNILEVMIYYYGKSKWCEILMRHNKD